MKQLRQHGVVYQLQKLTDNKAYILRTEIKSVHDKNNVPTQMKVRVSKDGTVDLDGSIVDLDDFR